MASIRFFHIENNLPDPFQDAPLLHLLLRDIKRSVGLSSKRRLPITMWSSNCFALYIRTPSSILQKLPGLLATAAAGTQTAWNPQEGRCTHLT